MSEHEHTGAEQTIAVEWARIERATSRLRSARGSGERRERPLRATDASAPFRSRRTASRSAKGLPGRFPESEPYHSPRSNGKRLLGLVQPPNDAYAEPRPTLEPDDGS